MPEVGRGKVLQGGGGGGPASCLEQLQQRNREQHLPFKELILSRTALLQQNCALKEDVQRGRRELNIQTAELMELREAIGTGGSLAGRCDKCAAMQDELTVNLREKAADKQQLLALGQQVKDLQAGAERAQVELAAAHRSIKEQGVELRQAQEKMRDMEKTLEVSVSECAARAFEIDRMRPELAKLQLENQELVRRLVAHKEQEADKYNEIHSLQEQADRHKRSAELLARATAEQQQKGVADSREDSAAVTQLDGALTFGSKVPAGPRLSVVAHARSEVHALGHNTSGQMMITGSDDRMVKLWDSRNGRCLASLEGAVKAVMAVDFSRDGTLVLGASGDFAIRIWTLQTNRICHTLTGHSAKLYTAGFTPDSRLVYSGGYDRMIKLWDVTKGLATQTFHCKSSCNDTCVTPEAGLVGGTLVSVHLDAGVRLWDLRSGEFAHEVSGLHSQPVTSVMMHPTNDRLVLVNSRDDTLSLIDIRKYQRLVHFSHTGYKNGVNWNRAAMSPDGGMVVAGGVTGALTVWNAEDGEHIATLKSGHSSAVVACSWGANDQLCSVEKEHRLVLWD